MSWLPEIDKQQLQLFIILISGLLLFYCYWLIFDSKKIKDYFHSRYTDNTAPIKHIFFTKIMGFLIMGMIPFILSFFLFDDPLSDLGFQIREDRISFSVKSIFILWVIAIPIGFFGSKQQKSLSKYPQIRIKFWSYKSIIISLFGWLIYLLGYEILFRGLLLLPVANFLGFWTALVINTVLYSATHLSNGIREAIGSIPVGILLGSVCLIAETFWVGFFVHIVMSWTVVLSSIYWNPDMTFNR